MIKRRDIIAFLKEKRPVFERDFNVLKIGLIGSFARNEAKLNSDIDLIVEFKSGTIDLAQAKALLSESVQHKFGRRVDICREKYIKPYYKTRILKDAIFV